MADAMDVDYELSQQLVGHEGAVRCVCVIGEDTILSGGLDAQILMWKRESPTEPFGLQKTLCHHSDWITDIAPSSELPGGFYSASKDKTACQLDAEGNPLRSYVGHEGFVCCVVERGQQVVTGSWDGTAKVWDASTGEVKHTLEAGPADRAVSVAVLPTGEIVTGGQDGSLRLFRGNEQTKIIEIAHEAIIRSISVTSTNIVTASNDALLKLWSLDLCEMGSLSGHQNFVYGVAHSVDSQSIFSASEDCTLKRWSLDDAYSKGDMNAKQSILHAASVWQAAPMRNGDVATCCEDKIVRIWTKEPSRMAAEAERTTQQEMAQAAALEAASKGSSSTSMPDAKDISEMPTTIGKKNGEIKCFKEDDSVFAYSWNEGARIWDKLGEVTGSAGSQKKKYPGDHVFKEGEYDFIWDVEWSDKKALLPYNKGQNPMAIAEAFCAREGIRKDNIDAIRKFIVANCGGDATIGPANNAASSGGQAAPKPAPKKPSTSMFPLTTPLTFKDGKLDPVHKKLLEFNEQVPENLKMVTDLQYFNDAVVKLRDEGIKAVFKQVEFEVIHEKLIEWPQQYLFPVMDLWRHFALHDRSCDAFKGSDRGAPIFAKVCSFLTPDAPDPLTMCTLRYIANLFAWPTPRTAAFTRRDLILKAIAPSLTSANKNIKIASTTVLLNLAMALHEQSYSKPWEADFAMEIAKLSLSFLEKCAPEDADAQQRAALCIGTLLPGDKAKGDGAIAKACQEAGLLGRLEPIKEKVTPKVVDELKALLA